MVKEVKRVRSSRLEASNTEPLRASCEKNTNGFPWPSERCALPGSHNLQCVLAEGGLYLFIDLNRVVGSSSTGTKTLIATSGPPRSLAESPLRLCLNFTIDACKAFDRTGETSGQLGRNVDWHINTQSDQLRMQVDLTQKGQRSKTGKSQHIWVSDGA